MNVLVVAAHPDDEVLGPGATLAALARAGRHVVVLIVSDGVAMRHDGMSRNAIRECADQAADQLGCAELIFGGFGEDARLLDTCSTKDIVHVITPLLARLGPTLLFTHNATDINVDHQMVAQAALYAARPAGPCPVDEVLCFETLSATEQTPATEPAFVPNIFYDVTPDIVAKQRALACYPTELREDPHPRSVQGIDVLARYRGLQAGVPYAEAFALARCVRRGEPVGATSAGDQAGAA
jgi:LmbE family N-acetylglucosaminyl deacetylase